MFQFCWHPRLLTAFLKRFYIGILFNRQRSEVIIKIWDLLYVLIEQDLMAVIFTSRVTTTSDFISELRNSQGGTAVWSFYLINKYDIVTRPVGQTKQNVVLTYSYSKLSLHCKNTVAFILQLLNQCPTGMHVSCVDC